MIQLGKCFLIILAAFAYGVSAEGQLDSIYIRLWKSEKNYTDAKLKNADSLVPKMDLKLPTAFYVHGFTDTVDGEGMMTVLRAYSKRGGYNVLGLDYRQIADANYLHAATNAERVGRATRAGLDKMFAAGLKKKKFRIIGHSLGAHVAGSISRSGSSRLPRVTGLDPAGPGFYFVDPRLNKKDAEFVDVIHTGAGIYGIALSSGTADFFPNGGVPPQPGCNSSSTLIDLLSRCSHSRAWKLYSESVANTRAFYAISCPNDASFKNGQCSDNKIDLMGYATPPTAKGSYYLWTHSHSPYGAGLEGVDPSKRDANEN